MMKIGIKESGPTPRNMAKSWNAVKKDGYRTIGQHWHQHMRPLHFRNRASRRYGYEPRKGEPGNPKMVRRKDGRMVQSFRASYTGQKLRRFGHTRPLVFTGHSERLSRIRDVRNFANGARVVLHTPGLNRRHKASKINMREELSRVVEPEARELAAVYEKRTARNFNRIRERTQRRIT